MNKKRKERRGLGVEKIEENGQGKEVRWGKESLKSWIRFLGN